jgi:hypothetical protein
VPKTFVFDTGGPAVSDAQGKSLSTEELVGFLEHTMKPIEQSRKTSLMRIQFKLAVVVLLLTTLASAQMSQSISNDVHHSTGPSNLRVQGATARSNGAGFNNALAYTSNVTSGNLLVAFANAFSGSGLTMTISDTQGNTWTAGCANGATACTGNASADANGCIHDISGAGDGFMCMWHAVASSSAADTVTVTQGSGTVTINLWILEFFGRTTLDVAATSNGNSSFNTSCTSGASAAAAGAGELIVGAGVDANNATYTPSGSLTTKDAATKIADMQAMYNLSGSSGAQTFSATLSASGNWTCMGMAFK